MKIRTLITMITAAVISTTALAKDPPRTIIVRDGKVIKDGKLVQDGKLLGFDGSLFGPRAFLGVSLVDLTPELREHLGASKESGVLVSSVAEDSPAARAGVRVGDVIVGIDGTDVTSAGTIRRHLRDKKNGDAARLEILRGKQRQSLVATVAEREIQRFEFSEIEGLPETLRDALGNPGWTARIERLDDCSELQERIRGLESRLKELEKKLQ